MSGKPFKSLDEVIESLEICTDSETCKGCAYHPNHNCREAIDHDILHYLYSLHDITTAKEAVLNLPAREPKQEAVKKQAKYTFGMGKNP